MRTLGKRIGAFFHFFYTLGVAYHGWALLVAIASAAVVAWNHWRTNPTLGETALIVAVVTTGLVVVLAPPLVIWLRRQTSVLELSNPDLELVHLECSIIVKPTSYVERRRLELRARGTVEQLRFNVGATGGVSVAVSVESGGSLVGPMVRHDRMHYHINFHPPLEKNRERTVELVYSVNDPESRMEPYSRESITGFARAGSLRQRFGFEVRRPTEVLFEEEHSIGSGIPIPGTLRRLLPDDTGCYTLDVPGIVRGHAYVVSWIL